MSQTIGIVGLGLIGGSIAMRAKAAHPLTTVIGMNHRADTASIALDRGIIDRIATRYSDFEAADIVFVCTPIPMIFDTLVALDNALPGTTILTDVGSLKRTLWTQVTHRDWKNPVVLGHPMAGKETTGLGAADAELLLGKTYILIGDSPTRLSQTLCDWGCRVMTMTADDHDRTIGFASHLPYLAATLGAGMASAGVASIATFSKVAASGFRDTTRVSASDPQWGADVLIGNAAVVRDGIDTARRLLTQIESLVDTGDRDGLVALLTDIKRFRDEVSTCAID